MGESRVRYHLLALAVVLVWGVTFVCTKVLIGAGLHPVDIFWIRFVLAYAGIWLYILLTGRDRTLWFGWKEELVFLFLGITGGSFYFLTENTALAHTQASNVSFLVCSAPLFTAIFTLIYRRFGRGRFADSLERVRLGWPLIGGTVLALSGMALVAFEGSRLRVSPLGDLLAIGAALCWALYSLFMGEMARRYGTVTATRKVFFYGLLTIIPFLFGSDRGFSPELLRPFPVWGNLLFLGLVASLACFIAWNLVIDQLGNVSSTNYVYLNPVFTLLTAALRPRLRRHPCRRHLGRLRQDGLTPIVMKRLSFLLLLCAWLPAAGQSFEPFTFVQMSDPQIGFFDRSPGYGQSDSLMMAAVAAVNAVDPAFILLTGDLVNDPYDAVQDSIYRVRDRFSFRLHDCAFIGFDSNCILDKATGFEAAQKAWLEAELAAARGARHIFVFLHCPIIREAIDERVDNSNFPVEKREEYIGLFKKYGVTAVFAGHTHQEYDCEYDGIRFITAGPVGNALGHGKPGYEVVRVTADGFTAEDVPTPGVKVRRPSFGGGFPGGRPGGRPGRTN